MISIVGLGYGSIDDLTIKTFKMLKEAKNVFVNNLEYSIVNSLKEEGVVFKDYKELLVNIEKYSELDENTVYAVWGNTFENDEVIIRCKEKNINYNLYEGYGIEAFLERCIGEKVGDIITLNPCNISKWNIDKRKSFIITDLISEKDINKVKSELLKVYYKDTDIYHIKAGSNKIEAKYRIDDIDKIEGLDEQSLIYVKENSKGKKDIHDLMAVIEVLRGENGCPWDKEQTHDSIKKDIVEESYEVLDAIDNENVEGIIEELGDVLFQVLFHASLGREEEEFSLLDITDGISNKMIYRHPHVFGNTSVNSTEEVLVNWDELKKNEKNFESLSDELTGVAKALPALIRAKKIQKKAKKVGFDWDDVSGAFDKVKEELNEVIDVYKEGKVSRIKEEIGDLLFSCVNVSRFLSVDPEEALNLTTDKFINRFSYIERRAKELSSNLEEMSLEDMDKLWDEAKKLEKR